MLWKERFKWGHLTEMPPLSGDVGDLPNFYAGGIQRSIERGGLIFEGLPHGVGVRLPSTVAHGYAPPCRHESSRGASDAASDAGRLG